MMSDLDDLTKRAFAAYFRAGNDIQPNSGSSGVETVNKLDYVVLRNVNGILAVYRVRNDGKLKGLKKWPKELD